MQPCAIHPLSCGIANQWSAEVHQARTTATSPLYGDLRHTYATLLIAAGANPLTVKQRMGHSSITVTMDRYGHLFPHLEEDITEKMDEAYRAVNE